MKTQHIVGAIVVVIAILAAVFLAGSKDEPAPTPAAAPSQTEGMSGMSGMSGMDGMSGMSGMDGMSGMSGMDGMSGMSGMSAEQGAPAATPECARYDLVNGAWVCSADAPENSN